MIQPWLEDLMTKHFSWVTGDDPMLLPIVVVNHLFLQLRCQYHALQIPIKWGKIVEGNVEITCEYVCVCGLLSVFSKHITP